MATQPQLVFEFEVYNPKNGETSIQTGIGASADSALADIQGRYPSSRRFTLVSPDPIGQRVETRTSTEGSRATTYSIVGVNESPERRLVDNRTAQEIANEKAYSELYKSSGIQRNEGESIAQYTKRVYVPPASVPTNAGQVGAGMGTAGLPSGSPTFGNVSSASASTSGVSAALDTQMKAYQEQLARAEREQAKTSKSMLDFLKSAPSQTDLREDAYDDIGMDPSQYFSDQKARIAEIDALTQAYNAQVAAKDAAIAQSYDKLSTNSFINNQIGQIERNAAPRLNQMSANINSKAAVLQALQGNFAEARSFVDQAVQDAVADQKFQLDLFTTMYQMNEDKINRLDIKYQDAFDKSFQIAQQEYENARADKMAVGELMLKYYESGITINDTLDQALAKAVASGADPQTAFQNALDAQQEARLGSESGSDDGSDEDLRADVVSYLADIRSGDMTKEEAYNELRILYPTASPKTIQQLLGYTPPSASTIPQQSGLQSPYQPPRTTTTSTNSSTPVQSPLTGLMSGYKPVDFNTITSGISNFFK